jgi:hypothetical protein
MDICNRCKKCHSIEFHRLDDHKNNLFRYVIVDGNKETLFRRTIAYGDYECKDMDAGLFWEFRSCVYYIKSEKVVNYDPFFHKKSLIKLKKVEKDILKVIAKDILRKLEICPYRFEKEIL